MVGQLDFSHTTRAESLGEGVVSENTIGVAALGRFEAALRMTLRQGWGLFNILAWAFGRRAGVGRGEGGKGKGHCAALGPPRAEWEPWWAWWEGEKRDVCGIRVDKCMRLDYRPDLVCLTTPANKLKPRNDSTRSS